MLKFVTLNRLMAIGNTYLVFAFTVTRDTVLPSECKFTLNNPEIPFGSDPFIRTPLFVPSQYNTTGLALKTLKALAPEFVIVPWGITAGTQSECGTSGFNAAGYALQAASFLKSAFVIGANGVGPRVYGKYKASQKFSQSNLAYQQHLLPAFGAQTFETINTYHRCIAVPAAMPILQGTA